MSDYIIYANIIINVIVYISYLIHKYIKKNNYTCNKCKINKNDQLIENNLKIISHNVIPNINIEKEFLTIPQLTNKINMTLCET